MLGTILWVAQVLLVLGVTAVILAALGSLGLAVAVGPSGGSPTRLDPTGTLLVVVAVLGALVTVLAVVVFVWWVRGLWRGGWRRTFTAMVVLVLAAAGAAWAAHDEPIGLLRGAQIGVPVFDLLLFLTPAARRWRLRGDGVRARRTAPQTESQAPLPTT